MHSFIIITILAGACVAHYNDAYNNRNLIVREEPDSDVPGVLVECPVCENVDGIFPNEKCDIVKEGKRYKKCERGVYMNEVCGNRLDCFRGPGENCSEKMLYDQYGMKCAVGLYCKDVFHKCTGPGYTIDSNQLYVLNHLYRYPLRSTQDRTSINSDSARLLV